MATMMLSPVIGRLRGPIAAFQTSQVNFHPALLLPITSLHLTINTMSTTSADNVKDQVQEFVDAPRQFFKDGAQFINRCRKPDQKGTLFNRVLTYTRASFYDYSILILSLSLCCRILENHTSRCYGICCSRCPWILCQGKGRGYGNDRNGRGYSSTLMELVDSYSY